MNAIYSMAMPMSICALMGAYIKTPWFLKGLIEGALTHLVQLERHRLNRTE